MKKFQKMLFLFLFTTIMISGCSNEKNTANREKITINSSIYPLEYLAKEIGGSNVEVKNIVPVGMESHDFEPSIKDIAKIKEGELFLFIGSGFEDWTGKLISENKGLNSLEASKSVNLIPITDAGHSEEEGSDHKDEDHTDKDPHIWLSPINMIEIGNSVKNELVNLDQENKEKYEENFKNLKNNLEELDKKYRDALKNKTSDTILVSHSAFAYLANEYSFNQLPVSGVSPDSEPTPKTMSKIVDIAKEKKLKYIYFETLVSPKSAEVIAKEAGLKTLVLNPIEGLTEKEKKNGKNYISLMEDNLINIKKELLKK